MTYAMTLRPTISINYLYFVFLVTIFIGAALLLNYYCNRALRITKDKIKSTIRLNPDFTDSEKYERISQLESTVADSMFNYTQLILGTFTTLISLLALIGAFLPETDKLEIEKYVNQILGNF